METFLKILAAIWNLFTGRSAAAQQQAGVNAQVAKDDTKAVDVTTAESEAVIDTPDSNAGLADIAKKGKW